MSATKRIYAATLPLANSLVKCFIASWVMWMTVIALQESRWALACGFAMVVVLLAQLGARDLHEARVAGACEGRQ